MQTMLKTYVWPLVLAVFSGAGVFFFTHDWEDSARQKKGVPQAEWQGEARRRGWLPTGECPASPTTVALTSPGDGALVEISNYEPSASTLRTDLVIKTSKALPETETIGIVI